MHSLHCYFDEFSQQLNPLTDMRHRDHLSDDPKLNLIETSQKQIQISRDATKLMATKYMID